MKLLLLAVLVFNQITANACTTFSLLDSDERIVAKNYDWYMGNGAVIANPRGLKKKSFAMKPTDVQTEWTAKYASITLNQYGREFPLEGMNEKGLVVEILWLDETQFPAADKRASLNELQWVQYQLDNFATTKQVKKNLSKTRISGLYAHTHYFVCDRKSQCAVIEFLNGQEVKSSANDISVLTNDTYKASVKYAWDSKELGGSKPVSPNSEDSLDRFARTAGKVLNWIPSSFRSSYEDAFEILRTSRQVQAKATKTSFTQWSTVYEARNRKMYFNTIKDGQIKSIQGKAWIADCKKGQKDTIGIDLEGKLIGDLTNQFSTFDTAWNKKVVAKAFKGMEALFPQAAQDKFAAYPEASECTL